MTAPRTAFRVPIMLAYLRAVSLSCLCSTIVSKKLRSRLAALAARNEKLHLDTVDLTAEYFDRLSRVDLNLAGMNAEAQPVEQIDCELGISNCLGAAATQPHTSSM